MGDFAPRPGQDPEPQSGAAIRVWRESVNTNGGRRAASQEAPALVGLPKTAIDTPALLVDVDVLKENIKRIADVCRGNKVHWRPHIKGQKVVEIARKQIAAGAIGVTCAKLGEAEV